MTVKQITDAVSRRVVSGTETDNGAVVVTITIQAGERKESRILATMPDWASAYAVIDSVNIAMGMINALTRS